MRRIIPLLVGLLFLTGCMGAKVPGLHNWGSGGSDDPNDPNAYYTGEPTPVVLELQRAVAQPMMRSLSFAPASEADADLVAYVLVQRYKTPNIVDFQRAYLVPVPEGMTEIELPIELPAEKGYRTTVNVYYAERTSNEGKRILLERSVGNSSFNVMAQHTNRVPIQLRGIDYEVRAPERLYSGGSLGQIDIRIPEEYGLTDITKYYGLNPWNGNGTWAFWEVNRSTGWTNSGLAPVVDVPTTLYYQFRVCAPLRYDDGSREHACVYIPDVEAGEHLFEVTIYPEPDDF